MKFNNDCKLSDFVFDPKKDVLGHGKYGYVYKVKCKNDNKVYALKAIKENSDDKSQSKNIKREFDILLNTNHENIEKFYGYFRDNFPEENEMYHFFILEFIDGENLEDMLKRKMKSKTPISQELIIKILTQIVKGLNYLHQNKILQRDLAPDNIMINKNNRIKITDFGLSKYYSDELNQSQSQTIVGRKLYASPEIFSAYLQQPKIVFYNYKTDIFSLGVIMFLLMTFNYPSLLKERKINTSLGYKDCIDKNLYDINLINIIMSMLEIQENKRPSCEEIMYKLYKLKTINNDKSLNIDKESSFTCIILSLSNIDKIYEYLIENKRNQKKLKETSFFVVQKFCEILKKVREIKCLNNDFINKFIEDISKYIISFEEKNLTLESIIKTLFDYFLDIFPQIFIFNNNKASQLLLLLEDNRENFFIIQKLNTYFKIYNNEISYIFNFLVLKKIYCPNCNEVIRKDIEIMYDIKFSEKKKKISDLLKQYEEKQYYLNNGKNKISCTKCGIMQTYLYKTKSIYNFPEVFIFHFDNDVQLEEFIKIEISSGNQKSELYSLQTIIFEIKDNDIIKYEAAIKKNESWIYYSSTESKIINAKDVMNKGNVCTAFYALSFNEFSLLQSKKEI